MDSLIIDTERLELAPFASPDALPLLAVFRDPAVCQYLLDDQLVDRGWVETEIGQSQRRFDTGSIGIWSVRQREAATQTSGEAPIIGFVGYRPFFDPPELQLIYGLIPAAWGSGYATEAAQAAIRFGIRQGLKTIVAATDIPNVASEKVMQSLGMVQDRVTTDGATGTVFYHLRIDG